MKYRVSYYNRAGKLKSRIVSAYSKANARDKFSALYENRWGYSVAVIAVDDWGS